ncbi:hypothetical protein [Chryseobacterium viscerum]|uniref:hypothetical protein n=1 Tax=Chryseobacterium viscerum TaxID=1037377 RepID=UPI0014033F2F|nr:hypothetical protein [Chryseobacterium viscerum]
MFQKVFSRYGLSYNALADHADYADFFYNNLLASFPKSARDLRISDINFIGDKIFAP